MRYTNWRLNSYIHREFAFHLLNMRVWHGANFNFKYLLDRTIYRKLFKKILTGYKNNFLHLKHIPININNKIGIMNLRLRIL
jgi:hypothetical protein